MRSQVAIDKEERRSEDDESDGDGALGLEIARHAGQSAEAVDVRKRGEPNQVPPEKDGRVQSAQVGRVVQDMGRP